MLSPLIYHLVLLASSVCLGAYVNYETTIDRPGLFSTILKLEQNSQSAGDSFSNSDSPRVENVLFSFRAESESQYEIKFTDTDHPDRFSMPSILPFESFYRDLPEEQVDAGNSSKLRIVVRPSSEGFAFDILRNLTDEVIFSCEPQMIFSDLYLWYQTILPSENIFGLGERNYENLRLKPGLYTLKAADLLQMIEDGRSGGKGTYSSHPVYLIREQAGNYNIIFYKNPTPTDVLVGNKLLTFKSIGGIPHFKVFLGDKNPETAIALYHKYLSGGHALPPFWVFGFHQSRWGYPNSNSLMFVINSYRNKKIPLDTIWSDIDFMIQKQTFSVDDRNFPQSFYKELHEKVKINYIPIVDVAVGIDRLNGDNHALIRGIDEDLFCRSPQTGERFVGKVWPGPSHFPDFFHPKISEYWGSLMQELFVKVNFTGMWLDMNEPANFCNGECRGSIQLNDIKSESHIRPELKFPFLPGNVPLETQTLPPHLIHYGGYLHKDVHNLYGFMDTYVTFKALKEKLNKVYPFILTRSSFPGSGRHAFKWTGDNASNFEFLQNSIPSIVNLNIFGIPFSGADICGFMRNTTPELCARWAQLGSLYPFARNHNNDLPNSQEFYSMGDSLIRTSIANLRLRYSLLKHYFMLFVKTNHAGTIFRPLFFNFPDDNECLKDEVMNKQFMLGKELMSSPVLSQGQTWVQAYFPPGVWYDLLTGFRIRSESATNGIHRNILNGIEDTVPLFISGGHLVGFQNAKEVQNQRDLNNQFDLICALKVNTENEGVHECTGNLLNLENTLDESEVQRDCDREHNSKSNCLIQIIIQVDEKKKTLNFTASQYAEGVWADSNPFHFKDITINALLVYGFPSQLELKDPLDTSDKRVKVVASKFQYSYSYKFSFESSKLVLRDVCTFTIYY